MSVQAGWDESKVDVDEFDFDCMTWHALRVFSIAKKAALHARAMNEALEGKDFVIPRGPGVSSSAWYGHVAGRLSAYKPMWRAVKSASQTASGLRAQAGSKEMTCAFLSLWSSSPTDGVPCTSNCRCMRSWRTYPPSCRPDSTTPFARPAMKCPYPWPGS